MRGIVKVLVGVGLLVAANVAASTFGLVTASSAVVSYGAGDYRYQQVPVGGGPTDFSDVGFDDSAFSVGAAPFGHVAGFGCGLSPVTPWSPNTDLLVRRSVTLPAGATAVEVRLAIDNDVELFWNGTLVVAARHDGCAAADSLAVTVPDNIVSAGANVLAVRASDRGGETFLDLQVTANLPPDCATVATDQDTLWPPSHDLRVVSVVGGTDPEGGAVGLSIVSVTQDELLDGTSDGDTTPDAVRVTNVADEVQLRAERAGAGDGRVYRLDVRATDSAGAWCSTVVFVGVPHDRGAGGRAIDTTATVVDSFGATSPVVADDNVESIPPASAPQPPASGQQPEHSPSEIEANAPARVVGDSGAAAAPVSPAPVSPAPASAPPTSTTSIETSTEKETPSRASHRDGSSQPGERRARRP